FQIDVAVKGCSNGSRGWVARRGCCAVVAPPVSWLAPALKFTGPCQAPRVYQPSQRVEPAPCQKTICWEPSTVTVALGEEVRRPLPAKAVLVQSMGPCQLPRVYQDSWRWPAAVLEKTSWVEPSGVTVTLGGELIAPNCMGPCQL